MLELSGQSSLANGGQQVAGSTRNPRRRTQAERRATTRAALLDATIDGLVEHGYTRLTVAQIAELAGVTRGAQAHYFATKAEMVVEALKRLTERLMADFHVAGPPPQGDPDQLVDDVLDTLWQVHKGPVFTAAVELWVAARTDPDLRQPLARFERELILGLREIVAPYAERLPTGASPIGGFDSWLLTTLAAMRGLAMLRFAHSAEEVDRLWQRMRWERRSLALADDQQTPV